MKIFLIIIFIVALLAIIVVFIGRSLPVKHTASITVSFSASPEEIWKAVRDVPMTGPDTFKQDDVEYRISNSVEGVSHVTTIITKNLPYGGEWNYVFEKEGSGCRLTVTEHGEVYNPFFRFMSKYILGHDGTLKASMKDLRTRVQ